MTDPARIAASLSEAQRWVLLDAWPVSGPSHGAFVRLDSDDLFESLEDLDLIRWTGTLTPLGLSVAQHIKESGR